MEELRSRLIRYLKIDYTEVNDARRIVMSQLGVMVTRTRLTPSHLLKYRGMARIDPSIGKSYHVGIVVRANGRWEVYSDFMLVYDWYDVAKQCIDVETDFNQFYIKFCLDSHTFTSRD